MPKRNLTVGITVPLKNFESLRIEVQDDVESEEDVRSLVAFLDQTLALFGRGNPETEEIIAHYRQRVMEGAVGKAAVQAVPTTPAPVASKPAPKSADAPAPEAPATVPVTAESVADEQPEEGMAPKLVSMPEPRPAVKPPAKAPAKTPAPSPSGALCEECGAAVSAAEEKTSRLFVSRTLCKKCIQSL